MHGRRHRGPGVRRATSTAAADSRIALPELGIGLVPGAGGTVSIPRRIGRHRAAALALSGAVIDGATALGAGAWWTRSSDVVAG